VLVSSICVIPQFVSGHHRPALPLSASRARGSSLRSRRVASSRVIVASASFSIAPCGRRFDREESARPQTTCGITGLTPQDIATRTELRPVVSITNERVREVGLVS
jgi:hypothetical protein